MHYFVLHVFIIKKNRPQRAIIGSFEINYFFIYGMNIGGRLRSDQEASPMGVPPSAVHALE